MDPKQLAQGVGIARIAFGIGFITMPGWTGRIWVGSDAHRPAVKVLFLSGTSAYEPADKKDAAKKEDLQLNAALNQLKGLPVISAATTAATAAATTK